MTREEFESETGIDEEETNAALDEISTVVGSLKQDGVCGEAIVIALTQVIKAFVFAGPVEYRPWMLASVAEFLNEPEPDEYAQ